MQLRGGEEVTLTPGQTFYEGPDDIHLVGQNASKTKPAKFVVFFVKTKDAPITGARQVSRAMMNTRLTGLATVSSVFLRLALGISFLSAVADRFGFWGVYGQSNVAWGNYARYLSPTRLS